MEPCKQELVRLGLLLSRLNLERDYLIILFLMLLKVLTSKKDNIEMVLILQLIKKSVKESISILFSSITKEILDMTPMKDYS